jgi:hypothetical protein
VLDLAGNVTTTPRRIALNGDDLFPHVSSPLTDVGPTPRFMITWERFGTANALVAKVLTPDLPLTQDIDLTRRYGFSQTFSRVDSDGARFAVACKIGTDLRIGTLAWVNNDLVLHEAPQSIGNGDYPYLASKRSGGGNNTDYGVVYIRPGATPRAAIALYEGRANTGGFNRRSTSCGLGIAGNGRPTVGNSLEFSLTNTGTDLLGLLLGIPAPALTLCSTCRLGLDPTQTMIPFPVPMSLPLPSDPLFVGVTLGVQGFALGSGPCGPAQLRLSDTIDFTIQ